MKEILELMNKKNELNATLKELTENNDDRIIAFLEQKFNLLGKMLIPYKEILKELGIKSSTVLYYSNSLDKDIKIRLYADKPFWITISFYDSSENSLFNIKSICSHYYLKTPVLQELSLEKIVSEIRKNIIYELKRINSSLSTKITEREKAIAACNIDIEVKLFENMLNDLFELNNQYRISNDEKLIPLISNIITAMEETLTFKE